MTNKKFLGFYWTLPVPWAGFSALSKDIDRAAEQSLTIHYQCELVRRWVKNEGGVLFAEEVFLELEPDRGSEHISHDLSRALETCRNEKAILVLVDFSLSFGSRPHQRLWHQLNSSNVEHMPLEPEPILIDGEMFDPVEHFRGWRVLQDARAQSKPERKAALAAAISQYEKENSSNATIAKALNASGMTTTNGKPWTADNLGKFLRTL